MPSRAEHLPRRRRKMRCDDAHDEDYYADVAMPPMKHAAYRCRCKSAADIAASDKMTPAALLMSYAAARAETMQRRDDTFVAVAQRHDDDEA